MSSTSTLSHPCQVDALAASRRLQTLAYELTVAETRERQRVAHVLHDEIGQLLAMAQFRLSELGASLTANTASIEMVEEVRALIYQAAQATRATTFELHPAVLEQLGLSAAIESMAHRMQRVPRMQIHLSCEEPEPQPPQAVCLVLLRTVRELALNAHKHSGARNLWITMRQFDTELRICVKDDGHGFDVEADSGHFSPDGGFGLVSSEAQMHAIGGSLEIASTPGQGTQGSIRLHLADVPRSAIPSRYATPSCEQHP